MLDRLDEVPALGEGGLAAHELMINLRSRERSLSRLARTEVT